MAFGDKKKQDAIRKSRENKQDITTDSKKKSTASEKKINKVTSSYTLKPKNKEKLDRLAREEGFDSTSLYLDRFIEREM